MMYLLQVSTCWIIFFGIYLAFYKRETFFGINRGYLIGTLLAGLVIPYLGMMIPANNASTEIYQAYASIELSDAVTISPVIDSDQPIITLGNALMIFYILGILLLGSRMSYGLGKIYKIYTASSVTKYNAYTLVESDQPHLPFSFFHFIFISKKIPLKSDVDYVIKHEELHINQWHTIDVLFVELLQVFFWFNPILILYKRALRQSHEYLADAYVTEEYNKQSYGQLLLRQSTSGVEIALSNQFFHSQIKQRITMMYQEKSKKSAMMKYLLAVPVLAAMLFLFSSSKMEKSEAQVSEPSVAVSTMDSKTTVTNDKEVRIDANGHLYFQGNKIDNAELSALLDVCKTENNFLNIEVEKETAVKYVTEVLDAAANKQVKVVLKSNDDKIDNDIDFDGRKIIQRISPKALFEKVRSKKGSEDFVITIMAEANEAGDVTYVEIIKDKTNIEDKEVLKEALRTAKGYKIEAGNKVSKGNIVFKGKLKNDIVEAAESMFGLRSKLDFENVSPEDQGDPIFKIVEEMPRFPGCEDMQASAAEKSECAQRKMLEFIYKNLKYPDAARKAGTEGMVILQFIVEKDGSTSDLKVIRELSDGCSEAAYDALSNMPKWIPGKQRGQKVRVQFTLPVKFKLNDDIVVVAQKTATNDQSIINRNNVGSGSPTIAKDDIYMVVDEMPRFIGCEDMEGTLIEKEECAKRKLLEYIYTNIKYPAEARKQGIEGMIVVQFVVTKEGKVVDQKTVRNIGGGCGEESLRIVASMPDWIPGKQNGKNVNVMYTLPIRFKLEGDQDKEDDKLKVDETVTKQTPSVELMQNVPNPFRESTTISFNTEQVCEAKFTIVDISNKVLKTINMKTQAGKNEIIIDAQDLNVTGVLYYNLEITDQDGTVSVATKKMIVLEK